MRANACLPIQWRTLSEISPPGTATEDEWQSLRKASQESKHVTQVARKQRDNGAWGGNMLGIAADPTRGIRGPGTVANYRHLLELGLPPDDRHFQRANRLMFKVLSRDPNPKLQFEYEKASKNNPEFATWSRTLLQDGVAAALVQAGHVEDPRVRGAAHRVATSVSQFLRSDLASEPFVGSGSKIVLNNEAIPPTLFTVATVAFMPSLQRERAGFVERLTHYLTQPAPDHNYSIAVGAASVKPTFHLLGDPLKLDEAGVPQDIPFALLWIEMFARMGMLEASSTALQALGHLLSECNEEGVWDHKNLRGFPKSASGLADYAFPLELDPKKVDARKVDVTFRLALIAKLMDMELEFT